MADCCWKVDQRFLFFTVLNTQTCIPHTVITSTTTHTGSPICYDRLAGLYRHGLMRQTSWKKGFKVCPDAMVSTGVGDLESCRGVLAPMTAEICLLQQSFSEKIYWDRLHVTKAINQWYCLPNSVNPYTHPRTHIRLSHARLMKPDSQFSDTVLYLISSTYCMTWLGSIVFL